ncbi:prepilin-type N-terminal cleavage/methylation domain-containing protein [Candidatus Peregrinibacteria bacterium]|nr:prepilin-type N-terminal cleavage/methylation domain-containing protein [Candidatus Peregrinibacteria bacterium]
MLKNKKGFTLIELLIVIGIIAILAGIVLVAVNPAQQFGKANDSERKSEIGTILSAVYQYQTSPTARGALPECEDVDTATDVAIPDCTADNSGAVQLGTGAGNYDCTAALVPSYLREIPVDPTTTYTAADTGYYICQSNGADPSTSIVTVFAPGAEVFTTGADTCLDPTGNGTTDYTMCVGG